jgi:hypothetical protein
MRKSIFLAGSVVVSLVLAGVTAVGCGGSDIPEAPPGVPMTPPTEDPALAEMMAAGSPTSTPQPSVTATAASPQPSSAPVAPSGSAAAKKPPPAASSAPAKTPPPAMSAAPAKKP